MKQRSWLIKSILLIIVMGGLLWSNHKVLNLSPEGIRAWMLSFGWAAPVLFILIYTVRPLILFPASILSLAADWHLVQSGERSIRFLARRWARCYLFG